MQIYNRIMQFTRQHLNNTTSQDWRHPHTFTKNPKRKGSRDFPERVVESSFHGDLNSESLRRGPRARAARCSCRAPDSSDGVLGKWTGFRRDLSADGEGTVDARGRERGMADPPSHQRGLGTAPTPNNPPTRNNTTATTRNNNSDNQEQPPGTLSSAPCLAFCKAGLRPSLRLAPRPVLGSTFLRGASRKASKGGRSSPLATSHRTSANRESRATPPPSHSVR